MVHESQVHDVLIAGLNSVLDHPSIEKRFDEHRWGNLFQGGMSKYFANLRDVNRYLSTLSFHVGVFRSNNSFEVNPVDLTAIEVIRLFEPEVYHELASNKAMMTSSLQFVGDSQQQRDQRKAAATAIVNKAQAEKQEVMEEMLKQLFPRFGTALGGSHYLEDFDEGWYRELRVCAADAFDRYFTMAVPKGDISQAALDRVLAVTGNRDALRDELCQAARDRTLPQLLDRLEAYKKEIPIDHEPAFSTAIFDVGDELPADRPGMFGISTEMHAVRIVYWHLLLEKDIARRSQLLVSTVTATTGFRLPVEFVAIEVQRAAAKEDERSTRSVDAPTLAQLKELCVAKLADAAANGRLVASPSLASLLYRWRDWAGIDAPRQFAAAAVVEPQGALRLAKAFLNRSVSQGMNDHVGRENWFLTLGNLETFVDFTAVEAGLRQLNAVEQTPEDRRAIEKFTEAVARRRAGKPDLSGDTLRED